MREMTNKKYEQVGMVRPPTDVHRTFKTSPSAVALVKSSKLDWKLPSSAPSRRIFPLLGLI